jgi:hypothetical protein
VQVSDVPEHSSSRLEEALFTKAGDGYVKEFSKDIAHIRAILDNYRRNADEILAQIYSQPLKPAPWEQALLAFIDKAKSAGIDWFLAGSCALAIRGVDLKPRGVDIILHLEDMSKVQDVFLDDTIQPIMECSDWVAKAHGVLFMHATIGLAFDTQDCLDVPEPIDSGPYAMRHLEKIEWKGHTVKVPPVALLLNVNKRRGRQERVRLIEEYMSAHR